MKRGNVTTHLHIYIQLQMMTCLPVLRQLFPWLHEYVPLAQHSLGNTQTVCQSETKKNSFKQKYLTSNLLKPIFRDLKNYIKVYVANCII